MARDRFQAGVFQINNPDASNNKEISVDNQTIMVPAGSSTTVVVQDQLSFDTGKVEATYIAKCLADISGNIVSNT